MRKILVTLVAIVAMCHLQAQKNNTQSEVIVASEFHISRPLREIAAEFPVDEEKLLAKKESGDRDNRKPQKFKFTPEDGPEYGNDPKVIQTEMGEIPAGQNKSSWAGQTASAFRPFDPTGAAGPNHYVQMINSTTLKVYNKTSGAGMLTMTLGDLWSPATGNEGDPIVMYDKAADRWFLAQFGTNSNKKIYIAVSTSSDPTGSYYTYSWVSPQFPDYLKFGVWQDGYYMTSNQTTQKVFCFERDAMLAGTPGARSVYTNFTPPDGGGFFVPLPGDAADGVLPPAGTPCPIFSYSDNGWGTGFYDRVNIYNMTVNWSTTTPTATIASAGNISTTAFDASYNSSWNDVSQPQTNMKLDGIGGVCMYRAQWKSWNGYNTVVLNWAVKINSTQRSIKWCEMRQDQNTGTWSIYQEGIYTPDAATRWMGAIIMDNNGSIGLSYMKSDATSIYPGLYYTGRRSCDPLGTLPVTETLVVAGTGSQNDNNRDGDYAHATLDPDGVTIWATSEYMGGNTGSNAAKTRIFSYQIVPCNVTADVSIAVTGGSNPTCIGVPITFTATPINGGTTPSYQWLVDGSPQGSNNATFTSNTLTAGQVVTCVLTSNLPDVLGSPVTSNAITISVSGDLTAGVSIAISSGANPSCAGLPVTFNATPVNGGQNPTYQWTLNGNNAGTNSAFFTTNTLTDGQIIACNITSSLSCSTNNTATSNSITMDITPSVIPNVTIAITTGSNPAVSGTPITFTATPVNGGASPVYQWYVAGVAAGTNSPTFTTSTLTNGQIVSCAMTSNEVCAVPASDTSNGITMNITGETNYCDASATDDTYEYISNVVCGAINNPSSNSTYTSYTTLSTNVNVGTAFSTTVSLGNGYSTDKVYIWVDWNHNSVFTDAGENVYTSPNGAGPFTANITPPANASLGNTRLRIRLSDTSNGNNATPCGASSYGEVEDYTLNVQSGSGTNIVEQEMQNSSGIAAENFVIYPNPSNGACTATAKHAGTYYLINDAGQLIREFNLNAENKYTHLLENLASGFYIVSGQNKYGIVKQKIIVTN